LKAQTKTYVEDEHDPTLRREQNPCMERLHAERDLRSRIDPARSLARRSLRSAGARMCQVSNLGTFLAATGSAAGWHFSGDAERHMHGLIYLVGLIVVIMAILSFFGLR
jgi:hypothetical protein